MKPEPLKDKKMLMLVPNANEEVCKIKDIKSAVEWLKGQLRDDSVYPSCDCNTNNGTEYGCGYCDLIDKAFEDVIDHTRPRRRK